jgi:hypothetical protein
MTAARQRRWGMTRWLTISIIVCLLALPACALAGNTSPQLYLEVYSQAEDPTDPQGPGFLVTPCGHTQGYPIALPCYARRLDYYFYAVPLHIGRLDQPVCPTVGPECAQYGGFVGCGFGAVLTPDTGLTFMSWNACPGFIKGPSTSGEPSSMLATSAALCHDWTDHPGYMLWVNGTGTTTRYINVVHSADLGFAKVINCTNQYDDGTLNSGYVQIGSTQTVACPGMPVEETTWGKVKAMYR